MFTGLPQKIQAKTGLFFVPFFSTVSNCSPRSPAAPSGSHSALQPTAIQPALVNAYQNASETGTGNTYLGLGQESTGHTYLGNSTGDQRSTYLAPAPGYPGPASGNQKQTYLAPAPNSSNPNSTYLVSESVQSAIRKPAEPPDSVQQQWRPLQGVLNPSAVAAEGINGAAGDQRTKDGTKTTGKQPNDIGIPPSLYLQCNLELRRWIQDANENRLPDAIPCQYLLPHPWNGCPQITAIHMENLRLVGLVDQLVATARRGRGIAGRPESNYVFVNRDSIDHCNDRLPPTGGRLNPCVYGDGSLRSPEVACTSRTGAYNTPDILGESSAIGPGGSLISAPVSGISSEGNFVKMTGTEPKELIYNNILNIFIECNRNSFIHYFRTFLGARGIYYSFSEPLYSQFTSFLSKIGNISGTFEDDTFLRFCHHISLDLSPDQTISSFSVKGESFSFSVNSFRDSFKAFCLKNGFVFPREIDVTALFTEFTSSHFDFSFCGLLSDETFSEFCSFASQKEKFNIFSGNSVIFDSKDLMKHFSSLCSRKCLVLNLAFDRIDSLFRAFISFRGKCSQAEIYSEKNLLGFYNTYKDILSSETHKISISHQNGSAFDLDSVLFLDKFTQLAKSKGFFIPKSDLLLDEFSLFLLDKNLSNPYGENNLTAFAEHLAIKTSTNIFNGKLVKVAEEKVKSNLLSFATKRNIKFYWTKNTLEEFKKFITLSLDFTLVKVFSATALNTFLSDYLKPKVKQNSRKLPFIDRKLFLGKTTELIKDQGYYINANYDLFTSFRRYAVGREDPLDNHLSSFLSCFSICKIRKQNNPSTGKNNEKRNSDKSVKRLPFIDKRIFFKKTSSFIEEQNLSLPLGEALFQKFRAFSKDLSDPFAGDNLSSFLSSSSKGTIPKKAAKPCLPNKSRSFEALKNTANKGDLNIDDDIVEKFRVFASSLHSNRFYHIDTISSFLQSLKLNNSLLTKYREFLQGQSLTISDEILTKRVNQFSKLFVDVSADNSSVINSLHSLSTLNTIQTPNGGVSLCRLDVLEKFQEFTDSINYEEKFFDNYLEILKTGNFPPLCEDSFKKLFETIRSSKQNDSSPSLSPSLLQGVRESLSGFPELNLRNLEHLVKLVMEKTNYLSKSQQISVIRDNFLGVCSSRHTGPPPFPLTEPLRVLATKVFETCKKDDNPSFVQEQILYLVSILDLPENTDSPDVVKEVRETFLFLLGSEQLVDIDDAGDIDDVMLSTQGTSSTFPLTQNSNLSSSESLFPDFQLTGTPNSLPHSPVMSTPNLRATPPISRQTSPISVHLPPSIQEVSPDAMSDPPGTPVSNDQRTIQTSAVASPPMITSTEQASPIETPLDSVSDLPLSSENPSEVSLALDSNPPWTFGTPTPASTQASPSRTESLVTTPAQTFPTSTANPLPLETPAAVINPTPLVSLFSTPFVSSGLSINTPVRNPNSELTSEPESENGLNLSTDGPATRQHLLRKFIKKMTTKEDYFIKFCKATLKTLGSNKSKNNVIGQCTRLISVHCASSVATLQSHFSVQGIIQRVVHQVLSMIEESRAAPST